MINTELACFAAFHFQDRSVILKLRSNVVEVMCRWLVVWSFKIHGVLVTWSLNKFGSAQFFSFFLLMGTLGVCGRLCRFFNGGTHVFWKPVHYDVWGRRIRNFVDVEVEYNSFRYIVIIISPIKTLGTMRKAVLRFLCGFSWYLCAS